MLLEEHRSQTARVHGRLNLEFRQASDGATMLGRSESRPPLQVIRAFPIADGASLVHLHNVSGGVLGGDRLEIAIEVGAYARAQLTTTGATRLYRCRPASTAAEQHTDVHVSHDGLLEYFPDPIIPFAGSRYRQTTRITLEDGAGLCWWEIVAPGREAYGEQFAYDLLETKLDLIAAGQPIALERSKLQPHQRPLDSPVRLGPYRYFATMYICRVGIEQGRWVELETRLGELAASLSCPGKIIWGVSVLPAYGLQVRVLAKQGRTISAGLLDLWRLAKGELYGMAVIPPRKVY